MKNSSRIMRLGALALLVSAIGIGGGCESSGVAVYGHADYGYGFHDPYFYRPWYGSGPIIMPPPRPRPVQLPANQGRFR